jgi:hypothetical protein
MKNSEKRNSKRKKIAILAALVIGFFFIAGLFLPTNYNVIRIRYIKAKPAAVAIYVQDLHKWGAWFPWKQLGKPRHLKFSDITGAGAHMSWISEEGAGFVTLTNAIPDKGIEYKLSLNDGSYECDVVLHHTEFKKGKTYVSWAVKGNINTPIVGGYMALLMEPVVGAILDRGLKSLKKIVKQDIKEQNEQKQSEGKIL